MHSQQWLNLQEFSALYGGYCLRRLLYSNCLLTRPSIWLFLKFFMWHDICSPIGMHQLLQAGCSQEWEILCSPSSGHVALERYAQIRGPELAQVHHLAALSTVGDSTSKELEGTTTKTYRQDRMPLKLGLWEEKQSKDFIPVQACCLAPLSFPSFLLSPPLPHCSIAHIKS